MSGQVRVRIQPKNPFDYTKPAEREIFVGRKEALDDVRTIILEGETPSICCIVGGPKLGKTSLLEYLRWNVSTNQEMAFPQVYIGQIDCKSFLLPKNSIEWLGRQVVKTLTELLDEVQGKTRGQIERYHDRKRALEREELEESVLEEERQWVARMKPHIDTLSKIYVRAMSVSGLLSGYSSVSHVRDFRSLGEDLQDIDDNNLILVLAFDDFDWLLEKSLDIGIDQVVAVLQGLQLLWGSCNLRLRLLQTLRHEPGRILEKRFQSSNMPEALVVEKKKWTQSSQVIKLDLLSLDQVRHLANCANPPFAEYVAREVFRESGGHPFLAQALYFFAFNETQALFENDPLAEEIPPVGQVVPWISVIEDMEESKEIDRFCQELRGKLPPSAEELLCEARRKKKSGEPITHWFQTLPARIEYQEGKWPFRRRSSKGTKEIIKSIDDSTLPGLLFRNAEEEEIAAGEPYLIGIEKSEEEYVIASRFLWRFLEKGVPRKRKFRPPEFDLMQTMYLSLFSFMMFWLILSVLGVNIVWAFVPAALVPLYSLIFKLVRMFGEKRK